MSKNMLENIIVKHYAGSIAYGTNTPLSDVDFRGIFMAPKEFILSPFVNVGEASDSKEEDTKFYELNKFMKLNVDANPNILETLWVDDEHIVESTEMYQHLRKHRSELLSNKIAFTYTGFAYNQVHRMSNHNGWMDKERIAERRLNEIIEKHPCIEVKEWMYEYFPHYVIDRIDFSNVKGYSDDVDLDLDKFLRDSSLQLISTKSLAQHHFVRLVHNYLPQKVLDRDFNLAHFNTNHELIHYGDNIFAVVPTQGKSKVLSVHNDLVWDSKKERTPEELKVLPSLIVKFNRKEYEELNDKRKHYHKWKENRNSIRAELESKNGFDTKHAMHVVRLLRTAKEALLTGVINVKRPDAEELLAIRNGAWTYEEMMKYFESESKLVMNLGKTSKVLPSSPNRKLATQLVLDLREMHWKQGK